MGIGWLAAPSSEQKSISQCEETLYLIAVSSLNCSKQWTTINVAERERTLYSINE